MSESESNMGQIMALAAEIDALRARCEAAEAANGTYAKSILRHSAINEERNRRIAELETESSRFYNADGTWETLSPAVVKERQIACAALIQEQRQRIDALVEELQDFESDQTAEDRIDSLVNLLERLESHAQLSPCPDLRAEIREAIGR